MSWLAQEAPGALGPMSGQCSLRVPPFTLELPWDWAPLAASPDLAFLPAPSTTPHEVAEADPGAWFRTCGAERAGSQCPEGVGSVLPD